MNPSESAKLVAMVLGAFPNAIPRDPEMARKTAEVYKRMLLDLDFEVAERAVARLIATSKFMPTIAEIRSASIDVQRGARRLGGEAWGDVNAEVRRVGRYGSPEFTDPLTAEAVRQLGWLNLCDSTNDVADRARFVELYDGLAARARQDQVAGPALALPDPRAAQRPKLASVPMPKLKGMP